MDSAASVDEGRPIALARQFIIRTSSMIGASHTTLERFVALARTSRPRAGVSVERLKAACQLEAPQFDAELHELISHVVVRTVAHRTVGALRPHFE